ncbi:GNAT family N-acetyltransferase [Salinibacterium sp.]|uniref:GNAT family N-acetyltransferase n=1 Tax=Salinibacterium sp. TaxID=1915057 RepID=UPI00286A5E39|nr:GNAT family N-acetyltransferase [Salinibacterium sp.]
MIDYLATPIDPTSTEALSMKGLHLALVDTSHHAEFETWLRADIRGFHGAEPTSENIAANIAGVADRRTTGVWDASALDAGVPVATVSSWPLELTVPGHRHVKAWAISSVTVAPTHRRRGIARALLEAELRTARSLGIPLATLTVSESTIYGRFGFAPAAFANNLTIDTRRAHWVGPEASGRLNFITPAQFRTEIAQMHDRVRLTSAGQIPVWGKRWDEISGLTGDDKEHSTRLRAVRYDDLSGALTGLALYRVTEAQGESAGDFSQHVLTIEYLCHETDEAYAGLWRYLLEVDLVSRVRAPHRSVDEPVQWQLSDSRAIAQSPWDHLWLRILDVTATLESRTYSAPGRCILRVQDDLGYATGDYLLEVDAAGSGQVRAMDGSRDATASVSLDVNALSALFLGGTSAAMLAAAGLIAEDESGSAAVLESMFHSPRAPWLSVWF